MVSQEAKARTVREVLSKSELQFGLYRGQTFKWLFQNDVGYACCITLNLNSHRCLTTRTLLCPTQNSSHRWYS